MFNKRLKFLQVSIQARELREAITHISACPTKKAMADGEAGEKANMTRDSVQSRAVTSPSCGAHVHSAPWMQGITEHTRQGFKKWVFYLWQNTHLVEHELAVWWNDALLCSYLL